MLDLEMWLISQEEISKIFNKKYNKKTNNLIKQKKWDQEQILQKRNGTKQ